MTTLQAANQASTGEIISRLLDQFFSSHQHFLHCSLPGDWKLSLLITPSCLRGTPICDDLKATISLASAQGRPHLLEQEGAFASATLFLEGREKRHLTCSPSCMTSDWREGCSRKPAVPDSRLQVLMNQRLPFDCRSRPRIKHPVLARSRTGVVCTLILSPTYEMLHGPASTAAIDSLPSPFEMLSANEAVHAS